jgi:toxin ParE1/3/4
MSKKRQLKLAQQAKDDLVEIWLYIAADSPSAADKFIDHVHEECGKLRSSPEIGRKRDELLPGIRSLPVKRYLVFYRVTDGTIEIARILSGYRDIETLF